jgi:hypothetical protein
MNKKLLTIPTALYIIFLAMTTAAYAAYTIYGNISSDTVTEYSLGTMSPLTATGEKYTNVTFSGTLLLGAAPATGKTVYLLKSTDNSTWTQVATNVTDASGHYFFAVNRTESGTFFYKPRFDAP